MKFGEVEEYEYYLLPKSKIYFKTQGEYKVIRLKNGGLRFRALNYQSSKTAMIEANGFRIIASYQSDFIIRIDPENEYFKIYVISGEVDIYNTRSKDLDPWLTAEQGKSTRIFEKSDGKFDYEVEDKIGKRWLGVIKNTTPRLLLFKEKYTAPPYSLTSKINLSAQNSEFEFYEKFPVYQLDLMTQKNTSKRDSKWFTEVGKLYYQLSWLKVASKSFTKAINLDKTNTIPYFYLANIQFDANNYKDAKENYLKVVPNSEIMYTLSSRLGQIYEKEKDYRNAERSYAISYDRAISKEEEAWSLQRLVEVRSHLKWTVDAGFDLGYDSNIFRSSSDFLPTNADTNSAAGYNVDLELGYKFLNLAEDELSLTYDFRYEGWLGSSLSDYSLSHQSLFLNWKKDIYKQLEMRVGAESYGIGSNRALDTLSAILYYHAPRYYELYIKGYFSWGIDPLPDQDDGFDPILHQTVEASDRSSRMTEASLGFDNLYGAYLKLDYFTREFTASSMTEEDYTDMSAVVGYKYRNRQWEMSADLDYRMLDFVESSDSRKDSIYSVNTDFKYYLPWRMNTGYRLGYESSNSNVSNYSYSRFFGYVNLSWVY